MPDFLVVLCDRAVGREDAGAGDVADGQGQPLVAVVIILRQALPGATEADLKRLRVALVTDAGSSIIDSAKLPVKHMPIAPTPGPPQAACAYRASDRSH